ncbi:unnamed protein product [Rhizophagus irregularis]|uniref:Galactose oxidase n=1 Tax=Rhizophagus irregularis TaxID=588596 RepID=A0A916EI63_9GLOM|nr:unnamed protein product [Rhizophagus irregularis]
MDNKIYFLGGMTKKYSGTNDFFYLDVSIPFNLDSTLPIVDLSNDARQIYPHSNGISTICGPNKYTIFLIFRISEEGFSYYNFIINDQEWIPSTLETNVRWSSAVCNKNGSYIYVYGRYDVNKHMMAIIDTTSWGSVSSGLNITYLAPAILLPDGRIAYIGKSNIGDISFNFRNIYIYNTNDGTWRNMSTSGIEPSPRYFHTTVLTQDGLIIIYGGVNNIGPVPDQISVLDTKVDPFTWSIPNIDYAPSSAPFSGHTATLVGNYMIIAFGYYRTATTKSTVLSDQIHMIDVREKNNYKWVKNFTPLAYPTKSPGAAHAAIIGGTTGGIATVIIIISVSYLLYRKKRTIIYAPQAKHAINC